MGSAQATGTGYGGQGPPGSPSPLSQAKTYGGVGSILLLLTMVPYAGFILGIAGLVLVLLAVMRIAESVGDRSIKDNMVRGIVLAVIGLVVGTFVVFAAMFRFMGLGFMSGPGFSPTNPPTSEFWAWLSVMLVGLVAFWAFYLASAVYVRRSFQAIATKLNVPMFGTAALLYLIGAALTIVFVGFVLILVAEILFVVAFFSIPEQVPRRMPATA